MHLINVILSAFQLKLGPDYNESANKSTYLCQTFMVGLQCQKARQHSNNNYQVFRKI